MKFVTIAAAAMLTATTVSAADIGTTGISLGAELDNRYNVDQDVMTVTVTPEVGYDIAGFALNAEMDFQLYNNDFTLNNDVLPTLDFGAEYGLERFGLTSTAYAESGYNLETEAMTDVEVGLKLNF